MYSLFDWAGIAHMYMIVVDISVFYKLLTFACVYEPVTNFLLINYYNSIPLLYSIIIIIIINPSV